MHITFLTTGGTIEKTYNEYDGILSNRDSVLGKILSTLRLPEHTLRKKGILSKDSLEMTDADRRLIIDSVRSVLSETEAVIVVHGTDTLELTGERLYTEIPQPAIPIILTGAMRPWEFRDSDALQNMTESILAATLIPPGVYAVMHGKVLPFPGVHKDRKNLTFIQDHQ